MNTLLVSHDKDIENKISYFVDRITERVIKKVTHYDRSQMKKEFPLRVLVFSPLPLQLTPDISHFFELIVPSQSTIMKRVRSHTDVSWKIRHS